MTLHPDVFARDTKKRVLRLSRRDGLTCAATVVTRQTSHFYTNTSLKCMWQPYVIMSFQLTLTCHVSVLLFYIVCINKGKEGALRSL